MQVEGKTRIEVARVLHDKCNARVGQRKYNTKMDTRKSRGRKKFRKLETF